MYHEMQQKKKQNLEQMKGYKYVFSNRKNKCLQIKRLNHLNREKTDYQNIALSQSKSSTLYVRWV